MSVLRYALFCGVGAAVTSSSAIAIAARREAKSIWQPVNATSHWLWGEEAGDREQVDLAHTAVGGGTNIAAAMFWGALFGTYLASRPPRRPDQILLDAAVAGAVAGLVDYGIMPRRLSPGWELALSDRAVVFSMASMALGLAAGGIAAQAKLRVRDREQGDTHA